MSEPTRVAVREARERLLGCGGLNWRKDTNAAMDDLLAARDAEWRRALETVRDNYATEPRSDYVMGYHHSLDALSRRMEARDAE